MAFYRQRLLGLVPLSGDCGRQGICLIKRDVLKMTTPKCITRGLGRCRSLLINFCMAIVPPSHFYKKDCNMMPGGSSLQWNPMHTHLETTQEKDQTSAFPNRRKAGFDPSLAWCYYFWSRLQTIQICLLFIGNTMGNIEIAAVNFRVFLGLLFISSSLLEP